MPDALTHLEAEGRVRTIEVHGKDRTEGAAVTEGDGTPAAETPDGISAGDPPNRDAAAVAPIAAIMGAEETLLSAPRRPFDTAEPTMARAQTRTDIQMEAKTAVGAMAIYYTVKCLDRGIGIGPGRLLGESGGRSGGWQ